MFIKLGTSQSSKHGVNDAFQRLCLDLRNSGIVGKFGFSYVPLPYMLWIWKKDLEKTKVDLSLN